MFVDKVTVRVQAGDGGNGIVSFRHEKYVDKGGPDGGDGGKGGNVVAVATTNIDTLAAFRFQKQITAPSGRNGSAVKCKGRSGADFEVGLPVGTVVSKADGTVIADLKFPGQRVIIAKGGKGGFGNAHFVSSVRQVPRVAEKGEAGEAYEAQLELKMIADVGLVGLPNAGKSTFLSVVSNARPEIADYPFTTLKPNLGVADVGGEVSLLIADIPGLIEGASQGKGLGVEFLRHVERTSVLIHLVDAHSENIMKDYVTITEELAAYSHILAERPRIVALSKIEGIDEAVLKSKMAELKKAMPKGEKLMAISSLARTNIQELLYAVKDIVVEEREQRVRAEAEAIPVIGVQEDVDSWRVNKTDEKLFVVTGGKIESFAHRTHFEDFHGVQRLRDIMHKMGIMNELKRQKVEVGDTISFGDPTIGSFVF